MKIPAVSKLLFSVKGIFLLAVGGKFVLVILNSLFGQIERKKRPLARAGKNYEGGGRRKG